MYSPLLTCACLQNKLSESVFSLTQIIMIPFYSLLLCLIHAAFIANAAGVYRHVEMVGDGSLAHARAHTHGLQQQ